MTGILQRALCILLVCIIHILHVVFHEILTTTRVGIIIPILLGKELSLRDVQCASERALTGEGRGDEHPGLSDEPHSTSCHY